MIRVKDKYINPFTDFGFKKLFGTELNKDILMDFLNELLPIEAGKIQSLRFLEKEQLGRSPDDRKAIFDIYCENQLGEKFIVEMQKAKQNYFKDRSVYYSTFPIQQQAKQGSWNFKLKAVYTIGILDFVFDETQDSDVFHSEIKLMNIKSKRVFFDKLTYIYLEMPKFTKTRSELNTPFEKWLYLLKNLEKLNDKPAEYSSSVFNKLFKQAEIACYSENEYQEYEKSLKTYRDLKNTLDTAFDDGFEEGSETGFSKGKAEGKAEGIEQGLIEGEIKGKEEGLIEGELKGIEKGK